MPSTGPRPVAVELNAVLVALIDDEPQVLTLEGGALLPSGPFEGDHPTLQTGVRAWVERQTHHPLGYVEQLYTFADRYRELTMGYRIVSISYLGLTRERAAAGQHEPGWQSFYRYFPWEDWREGPPKILARAVLPRLKGWVEAVSDTRGASAARGSTATSTSTPGTRSWCCSATSCSTRQAWCRKPAARASPSPIPCRASPWLRPSPHPRHRHRPAARQDQIPPGRVRADAARLHAGQLQRAVEALAGRPCTSRTSAAWSSSRAWSRRPAHDDRHRRPAGQALPLPPRNRARTRRRRHQAAPRTLLALQRNAHSEHP